MDEVENHRAEDLGHLDCDICNDARKAAEQHEPEKITAVLVGGPRDGATESVPATWIVIDRRLPLEQGEYRRLDHIAEGGRARFEWVADEA